MAKLKSDQLIPLTSLPREPDLSGGNVRPTYRHFYLAALDGRIPAQQVNGRFWVVRRSDLPAIARAMGIEGRARRSAA